MRIVSALVLFSYGTQKILGFPVALRTPPVGSLSWIAGLLELTVGFLLLIGFMSRSAAFLLSGLMAFAYFVGHFPTSFFPSLNGGVAAAVLSFVFLYLAASGPGPLSLDARLERSRSA
jgi:putative oxidoreductase